jgi:multidrug efflux system outer membrane protein
MRKPAASLALLMLGLAGCATAPAYRESGVEVPPRFREASTDSTPSFPAMLPAPVSDSGVPAVPPAAAASVDQTTFWRALGDSTLARLIDELLRANLDVQAAAARLRGARAARNESAFDLAPTVTASGGYTRQRLSAATFPIGFGSFPDQDIWDAGFDASWELDLFGRVRRGVQAQGALVGAASEDLRDVQVTLTSELARTYFELRGAQERLDVTRRNAENQRRTLQVTQQRLDAGRGTAFDTERAQAQLSFTLAAVPDLEARVASAQYQIGVLVGRPPASLAGELSEASAIPPMPAAVTVTSPDSLVRRRLDGEEAAEW